jgi:hypothetical protein
MNVQSYKSMQPNTTEYMMVLHLKEPSCWSLHGFRTTPMQSAVTSACNDITLTSPPTHQQHTPCGSHYCCS